MTRHRIVAIDDEVEFLDMLVTYFSPRGYDIDVSTRSAKGIEFIKEKQPGVVLCDLKMPGIDGDEVLNLTKTMQPAPKIIFITAYDEGGKTGDKLLSMGAYAFFDKPIASLKALEDMVKKAISS